MAQARATKSTPPAAGLREPIVRIAPGDTSVAIWSSALIDPNNLPLLRDLLARVFSIEEVVAAEIEPAHGYARVSYKKTGAVEEIWRKLSRILSQQGKSTIEAAPLYLESQPKASIRVNRIGRLLSTWEVRRQSPGKISLFHPLLFNRRDVAFRLEEELTAIPGVEAFRTSPLASGVTIRFNPRLLNTERLIRRLEQAWPKLLEGTDGPPSRKRLTIATGLLGLAYTGQYLVPVVRPIAVAAVALYGLPNLLNGSKDIVHGRVGLPALYSAGLFLMLLTGMPFSSSVMAVLMQFWPQLAHSTTTRTQRKLFLPLCRRSTWARLAGDGNMDIEVDADMLKPGDLVSVRSGDIIPVDGIIVSGLAAIDEQELTGVSGAQDKTAGDSVYAGSFMRDGHLSIRVERAGEATAAAVIATYLPHGKTAGLPASSSAERIANRNAKASLAIAGLSFLASRQLRPSQAMLRPDYATAPRLSAQLSGLHSFAEGLSRGILFREPGAISRLPATDIYVFDDTPGLTQRELEIDEVFSTGLVSENNVLAYAAAAFPPAQNERAEALQAETAKRGNALPQVINRERRAGAIRYFDGEGQLLEIAAPAHIKAVGLPLSSSAAKILAAAEDSHQTAAGAAARPITVLRDGQILGVITLRRRGQLEGARLVATLKARNKRALFFHISSDPQSVAEVRARSIGIEAVSGDLDATAKVKFLSQLGPRTIWIGNGADPVAASAVAASTVSVSLAGLASVAEDKADVVLLRPGLKSIVALREIGRAHRAHIEGDYNVVYVANLLGALGGPIANFGSLESGLVSNLGTGIVFARNWLRLLSLSSRIDARRARLVALLEDEGVQLRMKGDPAESEEEFVRLHESDLAPRLAAAASTGI